ncbi:MAG: hypothetical protein OJF51_000220 [Nitrospira sp.]|jgi:dsRNA-specific ribonuclease|nr:MAG: hypothetical protein OJF51_000220 [Nitrospira sp.]
MALGKRKVATKRRQRPRLSASGQLHRWLELDTKTNTTRLREWLRAKGLSLLITNLIYDSRHSHHCHCAVDELLKPNRSKQRR